jgi:hypothetical protein
MLDLDSVQKSFPSARFHADWRLMTWHPMGVLDNVGADSAVEFLESTEKIEGRPFDRYTDMTGYTRIKIEIAHIVRLAKRRNNSYKGAPVKSAFFAERIISLSIAQMYAELLMDSPIQVCLFRDRDAAAKWLGVPVSALKAPKLGR